GKIEVGVARSTVHDRVDLFSIKSYGNDDMASTIEAHRHDSHGGSLPVDDLPRAGGGGKKADLAVSEIEVEIALWVGHPCSRNAVLGVHCSAPREDHHFERLHFKAAERERWDDRVLIRNGAADAEQLDTRGQCVETQFACS